MSSYPNQNFRVDFWLLTNNFNAMEWLTDLNNYYLSIKFLTTTEHSLKIVY